MKNQKIKIQGRTIEFSDTEKIFYPKSKITKGDVIDYYSLIAEYILPHLQSRPISFYRYPNGIGYRHFVQQEVPYYFPRWIKRKKVEKEEGTITHAICNDKKTLLYLAEEAVLELHAWSSREDKIRNPDKMVFDLDPTGNDMERVRMAALMVRKILEEELKLQTFVMTTGLRGYHVVVPLDRKMNFNRVHKIAEKIARFITRQNDKLFTIEQRKIRGGRKVFIDYLRNSYGQTSIAPYSLRAQEGAPVATPLFWEEMQNKNIHPQKYNMKNIFRRLKQKGDPWKDIYKRGQSLGRINRAGKL